MKSTIKVILLLVFIFSIILNIQLYRGYSKLENNQPNSIKFEWEGLEKDIPQDGNVYLNLSTENNTVYLNPVDE